MSDPNEDALDRADQPVENIMDRAEEAAQLEDDYVELPALAPEKPLNFGE